MTLAPQPLQDKHCLVYCGPSRCTCIAGHYHYLHKIWPKTPEFAQEYPAEFIGPDSDNDSTPVS
jgi:hypothetical protein